MDRVRKEAVKSGLPVPPPPSHPAHILMSYMLFIIWLPGLFSISQTDWLWGGLFSSSPSGPQRFQSCRGWPWPGGPGSWLCRKHCYGEAKRPISENFSKYKKGRPVKVLIVVVVTELRKNNFNGLIYTIHFPVWFPRKLWDSYLTTERDLSYFSWLTPMTNMGASALGAEMMTLLAPPFKWACNAF